MEGRVAGQVVVEWEGRRFPLQGKGQVDQGRADRGSREGHHRRSRDNTDRPGTIARAFSSDHRDAGGTTNP